LGSILAFDAKLGQDSLLPYGILGGNIQKLPCCLWGLAFERVDEHLASSAAGEGVDDIGVLDIGMLIFLLGEVLNVLSEGLI